MPEIAGATWNDLKYDAQIDLFGKKPGRWALTGQNYLHALTTHEDYLNLADGSDDMIRMCSTHVKDYPKCGNCFMDMIK